MPSTPYPGAPVNQADIASLLDPILNVSTFNTFGDGVHNDLAAIQAALNASAAVLTGQPAVAIPPGTYLVNGDLIVPSGVKVFASSPGSVTFVNAHLRIEGSNGAEVNVTSPVAKGDTAINITSTTGLSAGSWIRLVSSINANSHDAGVDQIGGRVADGSFLSEFARIKQVNSSTLLTLEAGTTWAYPTTAGADSGTRTTSTVIPVTFNDRVRFDGIKFLGRAGANFEVVSAFLARAVRFVDCEVDTNGAACIAARLTYCLDSHISGGRYIGNPAAATAAENVIIIRSSTDCTVRDGARIEYGFQGLDVTYGVNDTSLWGGPSIACGAESVSAKGQASDSFTDHPGVYRTFFNNVRATGAIRGIRLRGRAARAYKSGVSGSTSTGVIGIFVEGGFTAGWSVEGCDVDGFSVGIAFTPDESSSTSRPVADGTACGRVVGNSVNGSLTGIQGITPSTINALINVVQVEDNILRNITNNPIYVSAYCNGTEVGDNVIHGVSAAKAGVTYEANIKWLRIPQNIILGVNATGFAVKGPGVGSFITDTTTFPLGNAEAHLFIADQVTDAVSGSAFSSVIRDATAFDTPKPAGWTGFSVPISTQIPADADVERNSIVFYLDGSNNVQSKFKNAGGSVFTKIVA